MSKKNKATAKPEFAKEQESPNFSLYIFLFFTTILLPVFHLNKAFDITLMPRTMLLGIFVVIFGLFFAGKWKDYSPWRHPAILLFLIYLASAMVSNMLSDAYREGLFDIAKTSMFISMVLIGTMLFFRSEKWFNVLPGFVAIAAIIAVSIGTQQYFTHVIMGTKAYTKEGLPIIYKVVGIMSHKNEYSNALLLMLPFLSLGIINYRNKWKWISMIALMAVLTMIFLVKSRAVWVGVIGGFSVTGLVALVFSAKFGISAKWRNGIILLLTTVFLAIGYLMFLAPKIKNEYSYLGRIQSIANTDSRHNIHRLRIWQGTMEMIQDHPVLGVGPGNWRMKYHPYVAGVFDEAAQINWAQPHNDFLWIFAEKGVIGFLAFAGFFIALIFASLKIIWKSEQSEYRNIALVLFGGVVGYIIISMFAFPYERINHQVYLSMISAGILATYARVFPFRALNLPGKLVSSFIIAAGIWGFIYGYNAVQQEMSLRRMFEYMNANNYKKAIQFANESRNPYRRVDFSSSVADYYISNAYYKDKQLDSAIVYCQKALEIFPENVVYANQMGKYLFEKKEYAKSLEYFKKAYKILTRDRKIFTNMAICNYQLGEYEEALRILESAPDHLKDKEIKARIEILENLVQEKKNKALPDQ